MENQEIASKTVIRAISFKASINLSNELEETEVQSQKISFLDIAKIMT